MKNPDLLTIGSIIISVALLAMATVLLLYGIITFTNGGIYFLGLVAALNGFTGALKAPSPQQADNLINALAASGPITPGPLVQIHNTPAETQVSSAALPSRGSAQMPQPLVLGPQSASGTYIPPAALQQPPPQEWQAQPQQAPFQVDRNWTGLVPTVPPGQPPQQP